MENTALVSDEQISIVASRIPANVVMHLARAYLELSDTDIENASGRLIVTLSDVVYKGWKIWISKHEGGRTVEDARELLHTARDNGLEIGEGLTVLGGQNQTDVLDVKTLSNISRHFTEEMWNTFSKHYLHLNQSEVESQLPKQGNDLHRTTAGILEKWRNNNGLMATLQHLTDVLNKAVADGCISKEIIQELHTPQVIESTQLETYYSEIESKLRNLYQTDQYSKMSHLHWESKSTAYPIQDLFVTIYLQKQIRNHAARFREGHTTSSITVNELLDPDGVTGSSNPCLPRRILIEGQSGSGKTTLCKKLAHDWSRGAEEVKELLANHGVFVIRLGLLQDDQSIASYIATELLNEPHSKYLVNHFLSSKNCLVILDAYDELRMPNTEVTNLIKGTLYPNVTVLVTSRHGAASELKNSFDLLYSMKDLAKDQILTFALKYAGDQPPIFTRDNVDDHSLRLIANTPLYLTWICRLHDQLLGENFYTVSRLFSIIVKAILGKAKHRCGEAECARAFEGLCNIAYCAMNKGQLEVYGKQQELTELQQCLGFTNTYYKEKELEIVPHYGFNHKTLLEYLAAKHIVYITAESVTHSAAAANISVVSMLMNIPEVENTSRRVTSSMMVQFVLGLLFNEERTKDISDVFESIVKPAVVLSPHGVHTPQSHYGLSCLAQCSLQCIDAMSIEPSLVGNTVQLYPDCQGADCVEGLLLYLKKEINIIQHVTLLSSYIKEENPPIYFQVPNLAVHIWSDHELIRMYSDEGILLSVKDKEYELVIGRNDVHLYSDSALTNVLRHAWQCTKVHIYDYGVYALLGAWRDCNKVERGRVQWRQLKLFDCKCTAAEMSELRQLLPCSIEASFNGSPIFSLKDGLMEDEEEKLNVLQQKDYGELSQEEICELERLLTKVLERHEHGVRIIHHWPDLQITRRPFEKSTDTSLELVRVFVDIVRYAWGWYWVNVNGFSTQTLLAACRRCSDEERGRVKWERLDLIDCTGKRDEERELEALLPETTDILCIGAESDD